ncbi:hypothetical protein K2X05_05230 [bacterium]|nr:hypothetical protein [bacterium]
MIRKLILLSNIFYNLLSFKILLQQKSLIECLNKCQKKGLIKSENEIQFVDKALRKTLFSLNLKPACLLHSLTLSRMASFPLQIHLEIENSPTLQSHAFIKYKEKNYSTSILKKPNNTMPLWSKEC